MNINPHFRYYAAFVLILVLALLMRVQAHATSTAKPVGGRTSGAQDFMNAGARA